MRLNNLYQITALFRVVISLNWRTRGLARAERGAVDVDLEDVCPENCMLYLNLEAVLR